MTTATLGSTFKSDHMRKFYNTPQPFGLSPADPPKLEGEALLNKLLSDFEDWRYSVNNRYCEDDPKVRAKFEADIAAAEKAIKG